jgi:catechol 2,3-dioxygenase-like lactoylglutathione lyase family enzyme
MKRTATLGHPDLQRGRASDVLARATALHHVTLETPEPAVTARFFEDFGLTPQLHEGGAVYLRAAGTSPYVLALVPGARARLASVALSVDGELSMRRLASLPGAVRARRVELGGGESVRLVAPGGLVFEAVHGVAECAALPRAPASAPSNVSERPLRVGAPVRVAAAPSHVLRLGHVALETPRPQALVLWLMRTFGMIVSDYQTLDEQPGALAVTSFLRCDLGETPADHHTLAVALSPLQQVSHIAFEVPDLDQLGRGAAYLKARGHRHTWGFGRHILGSQVFDYWRAPGGFVAEHYCDGDVFDAAAPTGRLPFRGSNLAQWGGPPPLGLALHTFDPRELAESARALVQSDASPATFARALRALTR